MSDDEAERRVVPGLPGLLAGFAARATSPSQCAEQVLRRVAMLRPDAAVLTSCDAERLRVAAVAATTRWATGSARALEGVPVVVKDNFAVDGFVTTAGGRAQAGIPRRQATVVRRLIAAGAIPYAKANMTEYALRSHGRNPFFGDVPAPGAPGYLAGGSSSGSAAAVRLGLAPLALGSDTGGSVRIPAACCGVVGYKPAYGDVPTDGMVALSPTCDHVGVLTASVDDLGPVLSVLGAPAPATVDPLPVVSVPARALGPLAAGVRAAHRRAGALLEAAEHVPAFVAHEGFARSIRAYEAVRGWEAARAGYHHVHRSGGMSGGSEVEGGPVGSVRPPTCRDSPHLDASQGHSWQDPPLPPHDDVGSAPEPASGDRHGRAAAGRSPVRGDCGEEDLLRGLGCWRREGLARHRNQKQRGDERPHEDGWD